MKDHQSSNFLFSLPPQLLFFLVISSAAASSSPQHTTSSHDSTSAAVASPVLFKVGLILDMNSTSAKNFRSVIDLAVSDFYDAHPNSKSRLHLFPMDSSRDVVKAATAALDLMVNEEVQAILGPQTSDQASFISSLGTKARVPIVSFSATSPALSHSSNTFFVRAAPSVGEQVGAIAAIVQAFGWRRVVPVYEDTDYISVFVPLLVDALDEVDAAVPYRCALPSTASDDHITAELLRYATFQTRVFVVHVTTTLVPRLFACIQEAGMMTDGYVWIVTESITSLLGSITTPDFVSDYMQGVLGVRSHIPRTPNVEKLSRRWKREFFKENLDHEVTDLSTFSFWAYDAVWALAMSAEKVGTAGAEFNWTGTGSTDLARIGGSATGQILLDSIRNTEFDGVSGKFRLDKGELNVTAYSIVNVIGDRPVDIGYWTPRYGLTKRLNWSSTSSYSATKDGLRLVSWPGELQAVPKGWAEPTSGRKLRIALPGPEQPGFYSLINVEWNPEINATEATGFVIDVFEAAVQQLPYTLLLEYVLYENKGTYDQLIQQVFSDQNFDALVGDVTITANRSMLVDFTLPYSVSGVSMVVPVKNYQNKNTWIFLRPLTAPLWIVSGFVFVFTGVIVWALERRSNEEFSGTLGHQLGTIFYFSFSTLFYAHREKIKSNLSKIVVIVWFFVVLILQSSYTASLTSMLTVQRFAPTYASFAELKNSEAYVGYLGPSFTKALLLQLGFKESKLTPFQSPEDYQEALSNGTIAAAIDEIPYLRIFLKDYCDNYTMLDETYKTGGFGFAFRKGSSLVPDLSRAILNITEGDEMAEIEQKWFGDKTNCPDQANTLPSGSTSLDFKSFWGLFLVTGVSSMACAIIHLISLVYQNRQDLGRQISHMRSLPMRFGSPITWPPTWMIIKYGRATSTPPQQPSSANVGGFMGSQDSISNSSYVGDATNTPTSTENENELELQVTRSGQTSP